MKVSYFKHILKFRFAAGTSRGIYNEKPTWIIRIEHDGVTGYGECGPLRDLSVDDTSLIDGKLEAIRDQLQEMKFPSSEKELYKLAYQMADDLFPSVRFGLETALLDVFNGGNRVIFNNGFSKGTQRIPINGLIWMGDPGFMREQVAKKLGTYGCIKMKVGALSFENEKQVIAEIRERDKNITLRLDANGAFSYDEAIEKLEELKDYDIHSIEQPLMPGQMENMKRLCAESPIPIALDEELIGINTLEEKVELLKVINPHYIILKPTLVGGFAACDEWITIAEQNEIGWWMTSALESNIGLNAIAQYTAEREAESFQGLGTGQLYHNNFNSPLTIEKGYIFYDKNKDWSIDI